MSLKITLANAGRILGAKFGDMAEHLMTRFKAIIAERDAAFTILKQLEFGNAVNGQKCLICVGWNVGPNGETPKVHTKDCPLGKLLAKGMTP